MGGTGIGRDVVEIASLLIAVGLVSMLVVNSGGTSRVIQAASQGFGSVLSVATFQQAGVSYPGFGAGGFE